MCLLRLLGEVGVDAAPRTVVVTSPWPLTTTKRGKELCSFVKKCNTRTNRTWAFIAKARRDVGSTLRNSPSVIGTDPVVFVQARSKSTCW
jgi:hypothetical protein